MASLAAEGLFVSDHQHGLKVFHYTEKLNSGYSGGFSCNICRKTYGREIINFHCNACEYDLCDKCLFNQVDSDIAKLKK
ncbi:MAG: DC1 domain-containing protein [bacterium]